MVKMAKLGHSLLLTIFVFGFYVGLARAQEVSVSNIPSPKVWTLLDKLAEKDDELATLSLKASTKSLDFYESRVAINSAGKVSTTRKKLREEEKEVGLKILNTKTGEIRLAKISLKIKNSSLSLVNPAGYNIEIVERPNGIKWNKWNTEYKIINPEGWIVLKNKFPYVDDEIRSTVVKDKSGKKRTVNKKVKVVKEFVYSPYSKDLHTSEIINAGSQHIKEAVRTAFEQLKKDEVHSRAFPGKLISDLEALPPAFFERLPILEHTDFTEFTDNPQLSVGRVLVIIGTNDVVGYYKTGSKAGALGWVQYTSKTYKYIRKYYPDANLMTDFEKGAGDHVNSIKAAILLYDYNLDGLIKKHGAKILNDPLLEEYLAAAYNGKPSRVSKSLSASITKNLDDWINALSSKRGGLAEETKGYMLKIRYLVENHLPS